MNQQAFSHHELKEPTQDFAVIIGGACTKASTTKTDDIGQGNLKITVLHENLPKKLQMFLDQRNTNGIDSVAGYNS